MKAHGLPKTTTNLDQLGVSAKVIQQILRHGNVATTMIYIKPGMAAGQHGHEEAGRLVCNHCATAE
jgi:hypothetical protein